MKGISFQRQHLRQIAVRRLATASCIAGFLTFLVGAWIVPWLAALAVWMWHQIPWWHVAEGFPSLLSFLAAPNLGLGLIWLGYYVLLYVCAEWTMSPRQKLEFLEQMEQERRKKYGDDGWSFNWATGRQNQPIEKENPLSQAYPGELKHQLVEQCYQEYRRALTRYDPPFIDLKTPETFFYRKGGKLEWIGSTLILPEEMLTPQRIHELLPFLAHQLYDYNREIMTEENTRGFPDHVPFTARLFTLTGNFLWLPVLIKHRIDTNAQINSLTQQKRLILSRDEFAVFLGQGPDLQHQLLRMEEALKERHVVDNTIPTLIERIGRLSVLNEQERKAMRALGLTPKEPPLVADPPLRQLGKDKK